jgi:hypothetical protein
MSKTQTVTYSVLAADGKDWAVHGQTTDMTAAMKAARNLLTSEQAPHVRVIKEFLDTRSGRNVSATILDEKTAQVSAPSAGGGAVRWLIIAVAMFAIGFGGVFAVKTFFL